MRLNRASWRVMAAFILLCLAPSAGYGLERDPYLYKTLTGRIIFEYEESETRTRNKNKTTQPDAPKYKSTRFAQTYALNFRGNLINRKAVIYSFDTLYANTDMNVNTSRSNSRLKEYNYFTTFLPKSAIPLTLFGRNTEANATRQTSATRTNRYGLDWLVRTKRLPNTSVHAERNERSSGAAASRDTAYSVHMQKEIGPSNNEANFSNSESEIVGKGVTATQQAMNFSNDTTLTSKTGFHVGLARSVATDPKAGDNITNGINLSMQSKPSNEFKQAHSYSFYKNEQRYTSSEGHNYSGKMDYILSARATSSLSLDAVDTSNTSLTSALKTNMYTANGNIGLLLTKNLSLGQSVSYSDQSTNATGGTGASVTNRTTFTEHTSLGYGRQFKLATLSAGYGAGYSEDSTSTSRGTRRGASLDQSASVNLGNINLTKYAGFNTGAAWNKSETLTGPVHGSSTSYNAGAYNKELKKYVSLSSNYNKSKSTSWIPSRDVTNENLDFAATSNYIKNTTMSFNLHNSSHFSQIEGASETSAKNFAASHNRPLFKGNISFAGAYTLTETAYKGGFYNTTQRNGRVTYARSLFGGSFNAAVNYKISTNRSQTSGSISKERLYTANYTKSLFRRVQWNIRASREESIRPDREEFRNISSLENSLLFQIRAWTLSAEHRYALTENESRVDVIEQRIMLRAQRSFGMVFF